MEDTSTSNLVDVTSIFLPVRNLLPVLQYFTHEFMQSLLRASQDCAWRPEHRTDSQPTLLIFRFLEIIEVVQ